MLDRPDPMQAEIFRLCAQLTFFDDGLIRIERANEAARNLHASQADRFASGKCSLQPEPLSKIIRDKLAVELENARESRDTALLWQLAKTDPALLASLNAFADRVIGTGSI